MHYDNIISAALPALSIKRILAARAPSQRDLFAIMAGLRP